MSKIKSYLKSFSSIWFWFVALLVTSLTATVIVCNYEYNLIGYLHDYNLKDLLKFGYFTSCFGIALLLVYLGVTIKKIKGSHNDAVALGFVLLGILFLVYCAVAIGGFNTRRILFGAICIVAGIAYLLLRAFIAPDEKPEKTHTKGQPKAYFATVIKKFPLMLLGVLAIVLCCAGYLFFAQGFIRSAMGGIWDKSIVILCAVLISPFVVYSIKASFSKKVTAFDALLATGVIVLPFTLIQLIMKNYSTTKMILWAIALGCFLISTILRIKFFDVTAENKLEEPSNAQGYFAKLTSKFDFSAILALAGVCATVALVMLRTRALQNYSVGDWAIKIKYRLFPSIVVCASANVLLAICAVTAYLNAAKKEVGIGDFAIAVCDAFVLLGFIVYIFYSSAILMDLLIGFAIYSVALTVIRIIVTSKK